MIDVVLDPRNARFKRLVADLDQMQGVYWIEHRGLVLKVGMSKSGIGKRLADHVRKTHADHPSHRKTFPAWHCFMRALIGREVTIRWQECSPGMISRVERAAIADAAPLSGSA